MVERCYTGTETELLEAKSPYASRPCLRSCEACVEPFVSTRHGLAQTRISRRLWVHFRTLISVDNTFISGEISQRNLSFWNAPHLFPLGPHPTSSQTTLLPPQACASQTQSPGMCRRPPNFLKTFRKYPRKYASHMPVVGGVCSLGGGRVGP